MTLDSASTALTDPVPGRAADALSYREIVAQLTPRVMPGNGIDQTLAWLAELADAEARTSIPLVTIRQAISSLGWADRSVGNATFSTAVYAAAIPADAPHRERLVLFAAYLVSQRLRFDFRFEALRAESLGWVEFGPDAQLATMVIFAKMGLHLQSAVDDLAMLRANFTLDEVCRDILLHALWFGAHLPEQAEQILALSDDILAHGDASANVYFRRAYAFRRKGNLDQAAIEIHRAIELLAPGNNDVHQDYVRELEFINTTALFREQVRTSVDEQLAGALESLDSRARAAEELVSGSMVNMVEVLGLFVALIGFLGAGAVTLLNQMNPTNQVVIVLLLFVGSIGFFLTLRFIVRSGSLKFWRRKKVR
jgi:hypothetical protein